MYPHKRQSLKLFAYITPGVAFFRIYIGFLRRKRSSFQWYGWQYHRFDVTVDLSLEVSIQFVDNIVISVFHFSGRINLSFVLFVSRVRGLIPSVSAPNHYSIEK